MREAQKTDSPDAAARPARTVKSRRRVRDTWRGHRSVREWKARPYMVCVRPEHETRHEYLRRSCPIRMRCPRPGNAPFSVPHGEAPTRMRGLLDLVGHGDRIVFERNAAALVVAQELIAAEPEFAGALARHKHRRRRQEGPVELGFLAQQVEERTTGRSLGLVDRRELRGIDQLHAGRDLEAAGAADHKIAADAGCLYRRDQLARIARREVHRTDGDV